MVNYKGNTPERVCNLTQACVGLKYKVAGVTGVLHGMRLAIDGMYELDLNASTVRVSGDATVALIPDMKDLSPDQVMNTSNN